MAFEETFLLYLTHDMCVKICAEEAERAQKLGYRVERLGIEDNRPPTKGGWIPHLRERPRA